MGVVGVCHLGRRWSRSERSIVQCCRSFVSDQTWSQVRAIVQTTLLPTEWSCLAAGATPTTTRSVLTIASAAGPAVATETLFANAVSLQFAEYSGRRSATVTTLPRIGAGLTMNSPPATARGTAATSQVTPGRCDQQQCQRSDQ